MGVTVIGGSSAGASTTTLGTATVKDIHNPGKQMFPSASFTGNTNTDINNLFFRSMAIIPLTGDVFGVNTNDDLYYFARSTTSNAYAALHSVYTGPQQVITNLNTSYDSNPRFYAVTVHPEGTFVYLLNTNAYNEVFQLSMSTAGEPATTATTGTSYKLGTDLGVSSIGDTAAYTGSILQFNGDGTKLYISDSTSNNRLIEITLSTGFDLSTAVSNTVIDLSTTMAQVSSAFFFDTFVFSPTGEFISLTDAGSDELAIFKCSTPYDLSTAEIVTKYYNTTHLDSAYSMVWNLDSSYLSVQPSNLNAYYIETNIVSAKNHRATLEIDLATGNRFIVNDTNLIQDYNVKLVNSPATGTLKEAKLSLNSYPDAELLADQSQVFYNGYNIYNYSNQCRTGSRVFPLSGGAHFVTRYSTSGNAGLFVKPYDMEDPEGLFVGPEQGRTMVSNSWTTTESYEKESVVFDDIDLGSDFNNYLLIAISPDIRQFYYQYDNDLHTISLSKPPFQGNYESKITAKVDLPSSSGYYNLSNDGRFLYRAAGTNIRNYRLTTPWDISTLEQTVHSTTTLPFTCDYNNVGVGYNGKFAQLANPNDNKRFYFFNMSTAHDLSTLGTGYPSLVTPYSNGCAQISHDNMYGVHDYHTTTQYRPKMHNLGIRHNISYLDNVIPEDRPHSFYTGRALSLNLSTADGGNTFIAHKGV